MCITALKFLKFEFPEDFLKKNNISTVDDEVVVRSCSRASKIPIYINGYFVLANWGAPFGNSKSFYKFLKQESLLSGKYLWMDLELVEIPAVSALCRGVWFQVKKGVSGVFMKNLGKNGAVFVLTKESTNYFSIMTGARRMPVLLDQVL